MSDMSVAESLLDGWDDEDQVTEVPQPTLVEAEPDQPEEEEEVVAVPDDEPDEEGEAEQAETQTEEEETAEEELVEALRVEGFEVSDPEVVAFMAQYQNDPVKALAALAHQRRAMDRQGTELGQARQYAQELERQLAQQRTLQGGLTLSQEQHEWAESAAGSGNPGAFVQQALNAGEFDLARAVCTYWAQSDPFNAGRVGQVIDGAEAQAWQQMQAAQMPTEAPTEVILDALWSNVPGMKEWEPQMVKVLASLGPTHHLYQEARSNNIEVSMRALTQVFEIAKASTASVQEQRSEIKKKARAEADSAKAGAAVTSSANAPSVVQETPRDTLIMPGLTMEDLDNAFAS